MRLAERIRRHRKESGLTQKEAGALLGVDQGTVSKWENFGPIDDVYFPRIANFLGTTAAEVAAIYHTPDEPTVNLSAADLKAIELDLARDRNAALMAEILERLAGIEHEVRLLRESAHKPEDA